MDQPPLQGKEEYVSQSTVRLKWKVLDASSQTRVKHLLSSVRVPVIAQQIGERRGEEAQEATSILLEK